MRRYPIAFAAIAAGLLAACDTSTSPQIATVTTGTTSGSSQALTIAPNTANIIVGGVTQLTTNAPATQANLLQWSSSQPTIAATSNTGLITGIAPGTAIISARFSNDTTNIAFATIVVNTGTGTTGTGNP
jgi:hypothetical protein